MGHYKKHIKAQKKTIEQLLEEAYPDEEVRARVAEEVQKAGTVEQIVAGKLVLPHQRDAALHFDKVDLMNQPPEE